jgi:hypothetical protein
VFPLGEASVTKTQSSKTLNGITFAPAALGVPVGGGFTKKQKQHYVLHKEKLPKSK